MQRVPRDTNHRMLTQERTHFSSLGFSSESLREKLFLVAQKSNRCRSEAKRNQGRAKLWWPVPVALGLPSPARGQLSDRAHSTAQDQAWAPRERDSKDSLSSTVLPMGTKVTCMADLASKRG